MNKIKINLNQKIHFMNNWDWNGGHSVMKNMGFKVQGSDMINSKNVERCEKLGLKYLDHIKKKAQITSIVIKSSAIKDNNPK